MARLGDICTVVSGSTPKTSISEYWDGSLNWITPAELNDDIIVISESQRKITKAGASSAGLTSFPAGTVILSSRAPIGKTAIAGTEMYCNQGFKNLICSDAIHNKYLFWFLRLHTDYLNSLGRGATFKEISKSIVEDIEIPLPLIDTQRHIAAILDKVNDLIALRKQQLEKLDELVKARFVEMFGDPVRNEKGWPVTPLGNVAEIKIGPFGSLLHKEEYIEGGHALVNPSHIIDSKICIDNKLTISQKKYEELYAYQLMPGDIVLGRRGEMGRCAIVYKEGLLCGTGSMILRVDGKIVRPYFLQAILSSPTYKKYIEDSAVGVTMQNLNVPIVSSLMIPLYPPEKQVEYSHLLYHTDMDKNTVRKSIQALETLKSALMQEYFG